MKRMTVSMTSITQANKGYEALARAGIKARIVKLSVERSARGCSYGLEIWGKADKQSITNILRQNRVRFSSIYAE